MAIIWELSSLEALTGPGMHEEREYFGRREGLLARTALMLLLWALLERS